MRTRMRWVEADRCRTDGIGLPHPVGALVLDLDGTLLDTETQYRAAFMHTLAAFGRRLDHASYETLIGLPSTTRRSVLPALLGAGFPVETFLAAYRRRRTEVLAGQVVLKPGAVQVLDAARRAGLACAVATSASRRTALSHLRCAGLLHRFTALATRDDVAAGKPAPDVFLHVAGRLGMAPHACLAVEDSHHGVAAAHDAGLMVVMVPDLQAATPRTRRCCVATVDSLHDVAALLVGEPARRNVRSPSRA